VTEETVNRDSWELRHYENDNIFRLAVERLEAFRNAFAIRRPKRIFARYEPITVQGKRVLPSDPTGLEFIDPNKPYSAHNHVLVSTGAGLPYPAERGRVIAETVEGIMSLAQGREVPIIAGVISFNEGESRYGGPESDMAKIRFEVDGYGFSVLESDGSSMRKSLEQWRNMVREELPPERTQIVYSFENLNKVEHWQDDSGNRVTRGYFSIEAIRVWSAESPALSVNFSGYALPMARQFLRCREPTFPLSDPDARQLQDALLSYLEPLREKGYQVVPWKSSYDR